ncbi:MAG: molybdopterin converting factor subunit 1 [Gammaproteobacteria bacterium]|nr:molybdopterin converting factor subunit 1 [Gammaproteobacteria bacterium]
MHIEVRFFASIREKTGCAEKSIEVPAGSDVAAVWMAAVGEACFPENLLSAVNMEYEKQDFVVKDKDEVAFFPPVTGG